MQDILKDYCFIYTSTLPSDRKTRHQLIQAWIKKEYFNFPSYLELTDFLLMVEKQNIIKINYPFEEKVIFPIFDEEIFHNQNGNAIKTMLLKFNYSAFLSYKNDDSLNLLQMALSYIPDDPTLLQISFQEQKDYYNYTIHEIPIGVLYDADGANIKQTQENITNLKAFKCLCDRLNMNEDELIAKCYYYYTTWIKYINNKDSCNDFSEFISQQTK